MLADLGYTIVTASTGSEAIAVLTNRPDIALLLTDVVMPSGMNGVELASRSRALRPELGVLIISGHAEDALEAAHSMGEEFAILRKPVRQWALGTAIRSSLDGRAV